MFSRNERKTQFQDKRKTERKTKRKTERQQNVKQKRQKQRKNKNEEKTSGWEETNKQTKLKDDQKPKKSMSAHLPDIQSQVSTKYTLVQMGWVGGGGGSYYVS